MQIKSRKTIRFARLVETIGHPVAATLWTAPEKNPEFSRAMREERVLTVIQRNAGTKADYGLVGFFQQPLATYLLFPKKLPYPPETKVIGIKYDQLAVARPEGPVHKLKNHRLPGVSKSLEAETKKTARPKSEASKKEKPQAPAPPQARPVPKQYRFRADVQIIARETVRLEVEATSSREAAQLLKARAAEILISAKGANITRRVAKPKRVSNSQ